MQKYDIFLVDADGTLLDFHASSLKAIHAGFSALDIEWKEEFDDVYTQVNDELWERLERREITREKLLEIRFPIYLERIGAPKEKGRAFNEIYLDYLKNNPQYILGAEEFLKTLKEKGRVFIVTNGTAVIQKSRFARSGLNELVDGVFVSQTVGYDKPH
ncbi:MAG: HAD hydrolase-like protein, partial [Clostridia bacterium]|nr:HAD hydrolase-like protein [Clostridia bacterium]